MTPTAYCDSCATRPACIMNRVPPELAPQVRAQIVEHRFGRGAYLSQQGRVSPVMRVLKTGSAFVQRRSIDGEDRPVAIIGRGAPIGALGFFDLESLTSTIAAGTVRLCDVPHDALRAVSKSAPAVRDEITGMVGVAAGNLATWSEGMRLRGIVNQLAYCLLLTSRAHGNAVIEVPAHSALAHLLGSRRETIVRAFATLAQEGCITTMERRRCEVHSEKILARFRADRGDEAAEEPAA